MEVKILSKFKGVTIMDCSNCGHPYKVADLNLLFSENCIKASFEKNERPDPKWSSMSIPRIFGCCSMCTKKGLVIPKYKCNHQTACKECFSKDVQYYIKSAKRIDMDSEITCICGAVVNFNWIKLLTQALPKNSLASKSLEEWKGNTVT